MDNRQRAVLLGLAVLAIVVGIVVASWSGGDEEGRPVIDTRTETTQAAPAAAPQDTATAEASKPTRPDTTIVVRNGASVEGVEELRYRKGGSIVFTVRSDVADTVHLHGYDVEQEVQAGGRVRFDVPATVEGRFEVELEQSELEVARVEVVP